MCSSFSSPTKLAQKIKNSIFTFLFLHFLSNQTHKITQIYKIKRNAHKNLQNTKTFTNYLGCMDAAKWPPHSRPTRPNSATHEGCRCLHVCEASIRRRLKPTHVELVRIGRKCRYRPKFKKKKKV